MKNSILFMCVMLAACAIDSNPREASNEQASSFYCGQGTVVRCDGMDQGSGDFFCNSVCLLDGDVGGWCRHPNGNDAYHGICTSGFPPVQTPAPIAAAGIGSGSRASATTDTPPGFRQDCDLFPEECGGSDGGNGGGGVGGGGGGGGDGGGVDWSVADSVAIGWASFAARTLSDEIGGGIVTCMGMGQGQAECWIQYTAAYCFAESTLGGVITIDYCAGQ